MKKTACLCGRDSDFIATLRGFDFYDCSTCDLRFVSPRFQAQNIYDEDYFNGATHGFGFSNYEEDKKASDSYLNFLIGKIKQFAKKENMRLLDVGAANGYFISLATPHGFDASGIEVSESAVKWATGLGRKVECTSIESFSAESEFDVITILDVLEHLEDPKAALLKIHSFTSEDGLVVINVPDRSSLFSRMCGMRWHAYLPPEHWYYFNRNSLELLLSDCGFEVVCVGNLSKTFKVSYMLQTVVNSPQFPQITRAVSRLLLRAMGKLAYRVQLPLPLYDNLFVIAKAKRG